MLPALQELLFDLYLYIDHQRGVDTAGLEVLATTVSASLEIARKVPKLQVIVPNRNMFSWLIYIGDHPRAQPIADSFRDALRRKNLVILEKESGVSASFKIASRSDSTRWDY